ncbi:hypothetical protein COCC4DRAFT_177518 [Bipolaris maydis ATCC 48331]|uniref:Uncharacterized protein n=2 Tax=Cochliobolus heterostrophus TaxID=5016 RepID=M2TA82_COCH5|nr:uncharacterized protein COCC4DRAFT_177518 [Bipolaris maydis ATCC 48331]EMD94460.1 hypothetical protein COCHEDRAFT_1170478 [Bipolaris maydis C5]KAH7563775.1 hypothetical protein BM1_00822 [Bipolaris maydis]ENI01199.1 hypothetical protein COCC4DRAFT_177518 [Bipolaris maydis ATCC 48331]KAJ5026399.1 hypothetical protein J3E73DRAFT_42425 [Bipolaris maydis]KAJ5059879.1 hypothetical protein J3E74DRAFT_50740 [Bipolaris maydis]
MALLKRYYCDETVDGDTECFVEDGFWYTEKGIIIKWIIFALFFIIFFGWFVGGRIHARRRLRKGLPLLSYHRFLISYSERQRHGQVPQNHFTFYQTQNPYSVPNNAANPQYTQRQDGAWAEPPPLYQNSDAPPQYFAPQGSAKTAPNQYAMEMGQYGGPPMAPAQAGPQQSGVVGGAPATSDVEQGQASSQELPPRPAQAKIMGVLGRFRR